MKKFIGMLLVITMILSSVSLPFTGFAASSSKSMSEKDGVFSIEAENTTINKNFNVSNSGSTAGGKSLTTSIDSKDMPDKSAAGDLEFSFTPKVTGKHYFWVCVNPTTESKSAWLSIDGQDYVTVKLGGIVKKWSWVKIYEFDATAGKSTLMRFNTRTAYFSIDSFVITTDASYVPAGGAAAPTTSPTAAPTAAASAKSSAASVSNVLMKEKGGVAFIEAEKATLNGNDVKEVAMAGGSGGKGVIFKKNFEGTPTVDTSGGIEFAFVPPADGDYTLWARVNPTTENKGMWYSFNGSEYRKVSLKGEKNVTHWAGLALLSATKGAKVTVRILQTSGPFNVDCFVIGENKDGKTYAPDDKDFGLSGAKVGNVPVAPLVSKGLYPLTYGNIDKMADGVALLIDNPRAYAGKQLKQVDLSNEAVVPLVKNDRTLIPLRFIAESFGAQVGWEEGAQTASVALDGKKISIPLGKTEMVVDGNITALDVAAESINDRTMLPLRAVVEALGKTVFWDDRGLILITNKDVVIDKEADQKMVEVMFGYLKTGKLALNYAAAPHFTQSVIDKCASYKEIAYSITARSTSSSATNALYYLTLAAHVDDKIAATDGTLAKDAALTLLRSLIAGGHEPDTSVGPYWSHSVVSAALLLIKKTPVIYDQLTADEIARMDLLQACLAIAGNWGYNDANNYATGFDLKGNFLKTWNPNHLHSYLPTSLMGALYFGADKMDEMYVNFSYDEYMKKLEEYGFTNIITTWKTVGKDVMENGGPVTLLGTQGASSQKAGDAAGNGKGVKVKYKYKGFGLDNIEGAYGKLIEYTYNNIVINGVEAAGQYCGIVTGVDSPYLGYEGMMTEFKVGEVGSVSRSKASYCYDSMMVIMPVLANLKMFSKWASQSDYQKKLDALMYVGNMDLIFKLQQGYNGYANGAFNSAQYEANMVGSGYLVTKDLWQNFHCMEGKDVVVAETASDPSALEAEPFKGITEPPVDAYVSKPLEGTFPADCVYDLGKQYTGEVTAEFDLVYGNDVTGSLDGCVMFGPQGAKDLKWSNMNVLIQSAGGKINVRNAGKYFTSEFPVGKNYRYHIRLKINIATKTYSVWITPVWPTAGTEALVIENAAFRTGADPLDKIGTVILSTTGSNGTIWVENLKLSE